MADTTLHLPDHSVDLPSGAGMPLLGFGTWQIKGDAAVEATSAALEIGYRHLDTATVYGNEAEVGRALAGSGVSRDDVFVTTKCPPNQAGHERETLEQSLELLGTDHVDLWLIHAPGAGSPVDMWRAFVDARESGLATDIGVSNFEIEMVDTLTDATDVTPAVNQIEWSPLLYDARTVEEHASRGIALEGYSALRGGTLDHPVISGVAERLGCSTAQVIVRWHLQHGTIVIPKSVRSERIRANADVGGLELSSQDMAALDGLGTGA